MKVLPFVLAASCLACAQIRPVLDASGGMTFPDISGEGSPKEQSGWSLRVGAGAAIPLNEAFEAVVGGHFAMGQAGSETDGNGERTEVTLTPRFLEFDGTAIWKASTQFGILGGVVVSIPMGGTYEYEYTNEADPSRDASEDGDIDDFADETDTDINTFTSLQIGGLYMLSEQMAFNVSYLIPMGKYADGDGFGAKIGRLMGGISYRL